MSSSPFYPYGLFHPEQAICRASKEFQTCLPSPGLKKELVRSPSIDLQPLWLEDPWKWTDGIIESNQTVKLDSTIKRPVLVDVQETRPGSTLFTYDVNEQSVRYENILKFIWPELKEAGRAELDYSQLSDFKGLEKFENRMQRQPISMDGGCRFYEFGNDESQSSLFFPKSELYSQMFLLDFIGDLACSSKILGQRDGQVLFSGTRAEMKDLLSIVAEFYLSKNSNKWRSPLTLVPPIIPRVPTSDAQDYVQGSSFNMEAATITPLKSPKKINLTPLPKKKKCRKAAKERDLYKRSYFHACESLLSLIIDKRRGKTTILSLKQSGPEVPQLLTQFSASIAGTGLAVIFSVMCKVAGGRVPFCASKMLNTGLGLGLVWLSWAVNKLRDRVVHVSKNTRKLGVNDDEEMVRRLDRSVNEIFFRAATVMAVAVLRFA